jgi:hypothetical protein
VEGNIKGLTPVTGLTIPKGLTVFDDSNKRLANAMSMNTEDALVFSSIGLAFSPF